MVDRENMDFSNQPTLVFSFWYSPYSSRPPPLPTSMNCCFSAAGHPLDVEQRNAGLEIALPITVGSSVWIGAGVTVLPGVPLERYGSAIGFKLGQEHHNYRK